MIKKPIRDKIIKEYIEKKISYHELERQYGVNRNTIAKWIKDFGVETKYFKRINENKVITLYLKSHWTVERIAKELNVSISPIKRALKKHKVSIRDNSERHMGQMAWNKGKKWPISIRKILSQKAKGKYIGKNNPNWKGGRPSRADKRRNWLIVKIWRTRCLERDKRTCRWCGSKMRPEVNHIVPIREIKDIELLADVNNGITLCRDCHKKITRREREYADIFKKLLKSGEFRELSQETILTQAARDNGFAEGAEHRG